MASNSHKQYKVGDIRTSPTRPSQSFATRPAVSERHPQLSYRMQRGASSDSVSSLSRRPPRSSDQVVILVMGMTGSGKSTFINTFSQDDVKIGHSLCSSTSEVQLASFRKKPFGDNVAESSGILLDTPGFDDTNRSDTEILKEIATFLANLYRNGTYITGIIYMHRITDVRMQGSAVKNLEVFRKLCGEQCFPQVALVSTMWQTLTGAEGESVGNAREEELMIKDEFWGKMVSHGARAFRYYHDAKSAAPIMNWFINMPKKLKLNIQAEMVDSNLSLDQTEAGEYLGKDFAKVKRKYEQEIRALTSQIQEAEDDDDVSMKDFLVSQQREAKTKLASTQQELQGLRIDLRELVIEKAPEYAARISQMATYEEIDVEEQDTSEDESKIEQLQNRLEELESDYQLIEKQKDQEIQSVKRQDRARALEQLKQLEKKHDDEMRQVTARLHSEQEKRRNAENEADFERTRRQQQRRCRPELEFMMWNFGRRLPTADTHHGGAGERIVAPPPSRSTRSDDRYYYYDHHQRHNNNNNNHHPYAPTLWHGLSRETTSQPQTRMATIEAEGNELAMRPLRRSKTSEERRARTPPPQRSRTGDYSARHKR